MPDVIRASTRKELTRRTRKRQQTFLPPEPEPDGDGAMAMAMAPALPIGRARVPEPPPCRLALARWPDEWRERWGRRANAWEDAGLPWDEAESRAFLETWNERRALGQTDPGSASSRPTTLDAARN